MASTISTIHIDPRLGSNKLTSQLPYLSPLNSCLDCYKERKILTPMRRSITAGATVSVCPVSPKHKPLTKLTTLESGDVLFIGNGPEGRRLTIAVELKSFYDLVGSIETGRLRRQIRSMVLEYDIVYLLSYGSYRASERENNPLQVWRGKKLVDYKLGSRVFPYGWLKGYLFDLFDIGIKYDHVYDIAEVAKWLGVLHRRWSKEYNKHHALRGFDRTQEVDDEDFRRYKKKIDETLPAYRAVHMPDLEDTPEKAQLIKILSALPGVGFERARKMVDKMGKMIRDGELKGIGLGEVLGMGVEEWRRLLGRGLGGTVWEVLQRRVGG